MGIFDFLRSKKESSENITYNGNVDRELTIGEIASGFSGKGTYKDEDGWEYVGEFKEGKKHGEGTYTWADGAKYVGEWENGEQHGKGTMYDLNSNKFAGEWKNGKIYFAENLGKAGEILRERFEKNIEKMAPNTSEPKPTDKNPKKKTTPDPKKKVVITDDQQRWIELVDMRVNSMPLDFIERAGYTVDGLGRDHADEYKSNEFRVPEDVREEVSLDRVEGLSSVRDYIHSQGNKAQKFHLDASIKGALLYASSLGVNVDKYQI